MATRTDYLSVEHYSEKQRRVVQRLLDALAKNDHRLNDHYSQIRTHERKRGKNLLFVRIPHPHEEPTTFSVHMRDISSSGTSFIYPGELDTRSILVGIPIPGREPTWFQAEVVRCKQIIDEDFWDYGVRFRGRLS